MQAYIDGSSYNLTSTAANHWGLTQFLGTQAWRVTLSDGLTGNAVKTGSAYVRCVRYRGIGLYGVDLCCRSRTL